MFIDSRHNKKRQLRRSAIHVRFVTTSLLRISGINANSRFYKYFALAALLAAAVLGFGVFRASNSHASTSFEEQSPQQQMQFPEGLDYSKFQHSSHYHSRLP